MMPPWPLHTNPALFSQVLPRPPIRFFSATWPSASALFARLVRSHENLSQLAEVSERHLAQLESGEGNISILLLNRIASALNTSLAELFTHQSESFAPQSSPRLKRIALIGLRGAGKSTLGEKLAVTRNIPFIELDREIEKETGMPLADIFSLRTVRLSRHRAPHARARHQRMRLRSFLRRRRCRHRTRNLRFSPCELFHDLD